MKAVFNITNLFRLYFLLACAGVLAFIMDFGFEQTSRIQAYIFYFYAFVILFGVVSIIHRLRASDEMIKNKKAFRIDVALAIVLLFLMVSHFLVDQILYANEQLFSRSWIRIGVVLVFIREFADRRVSFKRRIINPAQLFIASFLVIIILGALLLTLPNATTTGSIPFIDALFTSTSAVCVTGLAVVDTATYFTKFGQTIILILIQIGGLGILTFASYFSYFFRGTTSLENQLTMGEMTNSDKLGDVFKTLKQILIITFTIEFIGALFIFASLSNTAFSTFFEKAYFSVFHSVSSFCNAGFSTFTNGLNEDVIRFNYGLQLSVVFLIIMGGLGFPIVTNLFNFFRYKIIQKFKRRSFFERKHKPWVINLNSRITLITTAILLVFGTVLFLLAEHNNVLKEHGWWGKFVGSLFGAVTPRTAGFNTFNMPDMHFSTTMLIILLMWIGASPLSTGGGIKTSTFAVATLNFLSLARGKTRIEVFRREISDITVRRAFATISLSLVMIGVGIVFITIFDPQLDLLSIAFECFSAYSTVGLSLNLTPELSINSKFILICLMFVGRVSMLTILIAVFRKTKYKNYRYPTEEITIN